MIVLLIFVTIVGIAIVSGIAKAKRRMNYADTLRARRQAVAGLTTFEYKAPSWFEDEANGSLFQDAVLERAIKEGVPPVYIGVLLAQPDALPMMLTIAPSFEQAGRPFVEQTLAVVDWIVDGWKNIPQEKQREFRASAASCAPGEFKRLYRDNLAKRNPSSIPRIVK